MFSKLLSIAIGSALVVSILLGGCSDDDTNPVFPDNQVPATPSNPSPADGATDQYRSISLSWTCSDPDDDPLTYDVFFGTANDPPRVAENQTRTGFDPGGLNKNQLYYWKIISIDDHYHSTVGSVWSFTTGEGGDPTEDREFNLTDEVAITMVWIPAGSFMMGRRDNEQDSDEDEDSRHEVNIENGFWMGKYEVTQGQWETVTGGNPSHYDGENRPVEYVSWNDIHGFLSLIDDGFRLPSEAEWEYACRAGTDTRFYWGDDPGYEDIDDYAVYGNNHPQGTADVGTKRPNSWGLYDMSGNVWEWCEDDYYSNYDGAPDDGSPRIGNPRTSYRVLKGGSWGAGGRSCRSAERNWYRPYLRSFYSGFRLVLVR